jgi:hypothetical protein
MFNGFLRYYLAKNKGGLTLSHNPTNRNKICNTKVFALERCIQYTTIINVQNSNNDYIHINPKFLGFQELVLSNLTFLSSKDHDFVFYFHKPIDYHTNNNYS